MKERPILFSAPMVLALLAGAKTQTRRVVSKDDAGALDASFFYADVTEFQELSADPVAFLGLKSRYGMPGDRLWVKETWRAWEDPSDGFDFIQFRADDAKVKVPNEPWVCDHIVGKFDNWHPSIFMRRWMSRLTLEVTGVRVERLQEISEADAKAEGAEMYVTGHGTIAPADLQAEPGYWSDRLYRNGYESLWESINGAGSWARNPWVWAIEFRRVAP